MKSPWWLLTLVLFSTSVPAGAKTVLIDDFSDRDLSHWQSSLSPAYYRGGQGKQGLTIVTDHGKGVLRIAFHFGNPKGNEPMWVTRQLAPPVERLSIKKVRFRYRWEVVEPKNAATAPVCRGGFKVRLRTSPTSFTDFDVPTVNGGYPVERWVDTVVDVNPLNPHVRNIYTLILGGRTGFGEVHQLTFRLDDVDDVNARGAVWISDLSFEIAERLSERPYTPTVCARRPDARFDLLDLCHNGDGYYDFDVAAKQVDPGARVVTSAFRGLHFPLWKFPPTRAALLKFDVVVLGDVDPWVLSTEQLHWLADAVHSGVALLVCAGPQSFGNAHRHPRALLDLLPVTYTPGAGSTTANDAPARATRDALVAGFDPTRLGLVRRMEQVTPREPARVLLTAAEKPLLIAGEAGRGRVLVLTSWAQPSRLHDGSFMTTAAWHPFAARMLAWLTGRALPELPAAPQPLPPTRLEVRWLYHKSAFAPGSPFGLVITVHRPANVKPSNVTATLKSNGTTIWRKSAPAAVEVTVTGRLPNAAAGPVTATVAMPGAASVTVTGHVVDPLRRADFYPIITFLPTRGGGHVSDPDKVDALVNEVFAHGFNTIAVGGFGACAGDRLSAALRGRAEATAASLGMASILEYTNFTAYRRNRPYRVSPFSSGFVAHLRKRLAAGIEQSRYVPRLLSVKYVDEPFMSPACLEDSEASRTAFQRVTGRPFMNRRGVGEDPASRYAYARFLSAYLERDFSTGQKIKTDAGMPWDLLQTYCAGGYGSSRALDSLEDAYRWTKPADRFDFDVYPYFYPTSERIRFVQANWCFAASRVISRALGKPWGFYVELDDRNYPYQVNPPEASAECAYTAVASGADYLNTFILRTFGTGNSARPERWEKCGEAMRTIRALGPLLAHWKRQPARVAVLLPETQQFIHNGYAVPAYTLSVLAQALGDADVVHEAILASNPPPAMDVLVLAGVETLSRSAQKRLVAWVQRGGAVLFDQLPGSDEQGQVLRWPPPFVSGELETAWGNGYVLREEGGLEERCRSTVEGDDSRAWPELVANMERRLERFLRPHRGVVGLRVTTNRRQTDVAVRRNADSGVVVVVNHDPHAQTVTVQLGPWGFRPRWIVDLVRRRTLSPAIQRNGGMTLEQTISGRDAWFVGVYPQRPTKLRLTIETPTVQPGSELRYSARVQASGRNTRGTFLLSLVVTDPTGRNHVRLGGVRTTAHGICRVKTVMPLNAARGRYIIRATLPLTGLAAEGRCLVR